MVFFGESQDGERALISLGLVSHRGCLCKHGWLVLLFLVFSKLGPFEQWQCQLICDNCAQ